MNLDVSSILMAVLVIIEVGVIIVMVYLLAGRKFILTPLVAIVALEVTFSFPVALQHWFTGTFDTSLLLIVMSAPIFVILGALFGRFMGGFGAGLRIRGIVVNPKVRMSAGYLSLLVICAVTMTGWYYHGLPFLLRVLSEPISHLSVSAGNFRFAANKAYVLGLHAYTGQGAIKQYVRALWYLSATVAALNLMRMPRKARGRGIYFVVIALAAVGLFGSFEKHPLMWLVVLLAMIRTFWSPVTSVWLVTKVSAGMALMLVLAAVLLGRGVNYDSPKTVLMSASSDVFERLIYGNGRCTVYAMSLYPEKKGLGGGREHLAQLRNALPGKPTLPLGYYISEWTKQGDNARATYCTTTYLGVVYADFRFPGVMIIYSIIGILAQLAAESTSRAIDRGVSTFSLTIRMMMMMAIAQIGVGGPVGLLVEVFVFLSASLGLAVVYWFFLSLATLSNRPPSDESLVK